jgi:hypothetical protein
MTKIKIIAVRIGEAPNVEEIGSGLEPMQDFVDGPIELLRLDAKTDLWCNEEGKRTHSPNRLYVSPATGYADAIHGDFFLASHDDEGDTIGLTQQQQVDTWLERIRSWRTLWGNRDVN